MKLDSIMLRAIGTLFILKGIPQIGIKSLGFICIGLLVWTLGDKLQR